jgi:carboxyl-terminal processing protease
LNYNKKDKSGKATKTEEKNYNAFKTKKGRPVFDGGGVLPDIEIAETKTSMIADALQKNDGIFNYVTYYYYKNPDLGNKIPTITDSDFTDFKAFLKREKTDINTETEVALKNTLEKAKKENIDTTIQTEYEQLLAALQRSEATMIDKNQKELKNLMLDEIIKRYQYKEGLYEYYIKNNLEIKKAVGVLNNPVQYNTILKN